MKILRAKAMGFCFGVRDALATAQAIPSPEQVTILGELVHNERIVVQLQERGFQVQPESQRDECPVSDDVLITAHGISDWRRRRLLAAGKTLHDTTCPLVINVHRAARMLAREGRHVMVIGRPNHVEVLGIVEDLAEYSVYAHPDDVRDTGHKKLGVICQSTTSPSLALAVRQRIGETHPDADIRYIDTICLPTKDRQQAVLDLLPQIDALVVVGGAHSNNCRALADLARSHDLPAYLVSSAAELQQEWFGPDDVIGVSAGTSTPDDVLESVVSVLEYWSALVPARPAGV
jgi:4-hydroxy-3-methylbut-2-enyl diphosphate reductase